MNGNAYLALCICTGVLFGLAIHNIGAGLALGTAIGVAMKAARDGNA